MIFQITYLQNYLILIFQRKI